jgi:hypothetical protein
MSFAASACCMVFHKTTVAIDTCLLFLRKGHLPYLRKVNRRVYGRQPIARILMLLSFYCTFFLSVNAQSSNVDSTFYKSVWQTALKNYRQTAGSNLQIYKGAEYTSYYPHTAGSPFFMSDSLQWGMVSYDGILYPDLQLKYDLASNELLLQAPQQLLIKLAPEKVDSFIIDDHAFIKVTGDSSHKIMPPDFYERLYTGSMVVWLKPRKQAARTFNPADPDRFVQYDTYSIETNGQYRTVANEKDLLALFGDQRTPIKKYLRKEGVSFKKEPGVAIVKAVTYYDSLKK